MRNDAIGVDELMARAPDAIVLSPGPCAPKGRRDLPRDDPRGRPAIPIFGVCLGHQAIGEAFGGEVVRAPLPIHGKVATIAHRGETIFRGINRSLPGDALPFARRRAREPARRAAGHRGGRRADHGLSHRSLPIHGVQFHPESIASENGRLIMKNFLDLAAAWKTRPLAGAA